ncbi:hypothetical protein BX666DRAFT_1905197 [Dichotomocladium elegans]|nr:hypothetical protein BX666DRAFT_1905197 [Dichotomocladium elegans]
MHHLRLRLVEAYLYVRAHRLNVVIQPNLKFMYEMLEYEQKMFGTLTCSWPILCNEIHQVNLMYRDEPGAHHQQ